MSASIQIWNDADSTYYRVTFTLNQSALSNSTGESEYYLIINTTMTNSDGSSLGNWMVRTLSDVPPNASPATDFSDLCRKYIDYFIAQSLLLDSSSSSSSSSNSSSSSSSSTGGHNRLVTGTNTPNVDGIYTKSTTFNGKNTWANVAGGYTLWANAAGTGWIISTASNSYPTSLDAFIKAGIYPDGLYSNSNSWTGNATVATI
jgi:hypothetical protein